MKFLFAVLSFLVVGKVYFVPTTYYVTPSGSGTGTGLDSSNALSYAALYSKSLASGDKVLFKAGNTYNGQHMTRDGVAYDRYSSGTNPLISGFTTLSSWTLSSGNIYYTSLSSSQLQGVSIDGTLRAMGRYPNTGYLIYRSHSGNSSITGTSVGTLPNSFIGGEVVIKKFRYILDRHKITGRTSNTLSYSSTNFYGNSSNYEPTDPLQAGYAGNGYFIQNHIAALDQDGEWSYDAATSRLYVYFTGGLAGHVVKAATVNELVPLNSTVNASFSNIDFEGANTGINNNGTYNITVSNCNIRQCGDGIYAASPTNLKVLTGTTVSDCWSNGILVETGGHNTVIDGVVVRRTALMPGMGQSGDGRYNGIAVEGINTKIINCQVRNTGFNGVVFAGDTVLVEHNLVDTFCSVKDDGAGFYTFAPAGITYTSRIIRNNIALYAVGAPEGAQWNGDPDGEAAAIYLDGHTNHTEVSGNSVAHGPWGGIFNNSNSNNQIVNNTTYDFKQGLLLTDGAFNGTLLSRNLTITGNRFIARTVSQRAVWVAFDNGVTDNPSDLGTFSNNVIARPIDDSLTVTLIRPNSGFTHNMTLATWKSTYGQDAGSTKSQVLAGSLSDVRFEYNATGSTTPFSLGGIYRDVLNSSYPGLISLQPYSGAVLIYNSPLPNGFIIIRAGPYKFSKQ
jgi:hypothetical protein